MRVRRASAPHPRHLAITLPFRLSLHGFDQALALPDLAIEIDKLRLLNSLLLIFGEVNHAPAFET